MMEIILDSVLEQGVVNVVMNLLVKEKWQISSLLNTIFCYVTPCPLKGTWYRSPIINLSRHSGEAEV